MKKLTYILIGLLLVSCGNKQNEIVDFTLSSSNIGVYNADVTVDISYSGKEKIKSRGVVVSIDSLPAIEDNFQYNPNKAESHIYQKGDGAGTFTVNMSNLEDNGYYYCRAFAIISGKAYYSEQIQIHTLCPGLGEGPAGGYLIYDDGNGGGIEAAPYDIAYKQPDNSSYVSHGYSWGCTNLQTNASHSAIGFGQANTDSIMQVCLDENCAARGCSQYSFGGYDDWYLPSRDELMLMNISLAAVGYGKLQKGGSQYWSSTEELSNSAWSIDMQNGSQFTSGKYSPLFVRPIRSF